MTVKFAGSPLLRHSVRAPMPLPDPPLLLVCSVRAECARLLEGLERRAEQRAGMRPGWSGMLEGTPVWVIECGMGKANAAHALTAALERGAPRGVIGFGVGGAYPGTGLGLGAVALATASIYADEGVETPRGWAGTELIGIPLAERGASRWFNEYAADPAALGRIAGALGRAGIAAAQGPFLTVSACSGTTVRGRSLAARWGALCEGMEGAALAQVCALYGVPFVEMRAVSNAVEDRDPARWRLPEAADAVQRAVRVAVGAWGPAA